MKNDFSNLIFSGKSIITGNMVEGGFFHKNPTPTQPEGYFIIVNSPLETGRFVQVDFSSIKMLM